MKVMLQQHHLPVTTWRLTAEAAMTWNKTFTVLSPGNTKPDNSRTTVHNNNNSNSNFIYTTITTNICIPTNSSCIKMDLLLPLLGLVMASNIRPCHHNHKQPHRHRVNNSTINIIHHNNNNRKGVRPVTPRAGVASVRWFHSGRWSPGRSTPWLGLSNRLRYTYMIFGHKFFSCGHMVYSEMEKKEDH